MKLTIAAAALVVMAALLAFAGRSGASSNPGETVLRLTGHATSWAGFDNVPSHSSSNVPKQGFGPGDYVVYSSTVHREGSTVTLGRAMGECVRHTTPAEKPELDVCTIVVRLVDGQIVVTGAARDESDNVLAVIGGTGRYRGARGEASEKFISDLRSLFVLRFTTR